MEILATYERIVLSDLRPNLSKYETKEGLEELEKSIYSLKLIKDPGSENATVNLLDVLPSIRPGDSFDLDVDSDNRKISITLQPNPDEEELINIDLEPPFDNKGEIFCRIIEDEFIRIKKKLVIILSESTKHEDLHFIVLKFIAKAKLLGHDAHTFDKKLQVSNTQSGRSSRYVVKVLKKYLVYSILEAQKVFASVLKLDLQSGDDLEDELYEYSKTKIKRGVEEIERRLEKKRLDRAHASIMDSELPSPQDTSTKDKDRIAIAKTALGIIGRLNFEKACEIICDGISDRMPRLLDRIKDLNGLSEPDKRQFEEFEGLSREEIIEILRNRVYVKRDSLIEAYHKVITKFEEKSVDPEFTKDQAKRIVYENIVQNEAHFATLRQYPSDWSNDELFGTLWGYSLLIDEWNKELDKNIEKTIGSTKGELGTAPQLSRLDKRISWIKNHRILSIGALALIALIWLADANDALVKLGIIKDDAKELQRQEFYNNNPPQFDLLYSAFYPYNRDPLLKETLLDDTIGITGSYRLINKGRAIITLERINLANVFSIRGYFADRIVELPYSLSPGDTIVISCKLLGKEVPIIETENALKRDLDIMCSYPVADIRFTCKFHWQEGLFKKARVIIE